MGGFWGPDTVARAAAAAAQAAADAAQVVADAAIPLIGVTDGSSAAAGEIGEEISAEVLSASAVALTTGTRSDVASITLSPGEWVIHGNAAFLADATVSTTLLIGAIGVQGVGINQSRGFSYAHAAFVSGAAVFSGLCLYDDLHLTVPTVFSLKTQANFSAGVLKGYGWLRARRIR